MVYIYIYWRQLMKNEIKNTIDTNRKALNNTIETNRMLQPF